MLRALIWDVDGTLAETEEQGHRPAFNQAFADEGLGWHWDVALYGRLLATTGGKERMLAWWREADPATADTPEAAACITRLHQRKTAHYVARVAAGGVALRPGVQALLTAARAQGLQQAIATTTTPANVDALLQATLGRAANGLLAVVGAGDVVPRKKPAPDIYHWVLQRLGLRADECLAIEDSAVGARAALAAGLPVLVTRSIYTQDDALPSHPMLLADLDGLGEAMAPACGQAAGRAWQGVVDLVQLQHWWAGAWRA